MEMMVVMANGEEDRPKAEEPIYTMKQPLRLPGC